LINTLQNCTLDKFLEKDKNEKERYNLSGDLSNRSRNAETKLGSWSPKQRRCFQRIMSGLNFHRIRGNRIRFLTLTSSREAERGIQTDFRVLKERIKRAFGSFEYIKVRTNEGYGVLHILYVGCYIPQRWLSAVWSEIHGSPIVDIRGVDRIKKLGSYVVSQYLSAQRCSFIRYSWSWGWVYKGFVKFWYRIAREYVFFNALQIWNDHLSGKLIQLDGKYLKPPPDVRYVTFEHTTLDNTFLKSGYDYPAFYVRLHAKCEWL